MDFNTDGSKVCLVATLTKQTQQVVSSGTGPHGLFLIISVLNQYYTDSLLKTCKRQELNFNFGSEYMVMNVAKLIISWPF